MRSRSAFSSLVRPSISVMLGPRPTKTDAADTVAPVADYDFTYVEPNVTQTVTRSSFFPVTAAGALTYNLRGQDIVGDLTYYRSGLTLIFLP